MRLQVISLLVLFAVAAFAAPAQTFTLREYLGQSWRNEVVNFPLDKAVTGEAARYRVVDADGQALPFQLVAGADGERSLALLVDLPAFAERTFHLEDGAGAPPATDLRVEEEQTCIRLTNALTGIEIPNARGAFAHGPFLRMQLRSGAWIGGSRLTGNAAIEDYQARVTASGPVYAEVECRYRFAGGKSWRITYRLVAHEPAVVIDEQCNLNDGTAWQLLVSPGFTPTHSIYSASYSVKEKAHYAFGKIGYGATPFLLSPWPVWWVPNSVGFFGLFKVPEGYIISQGKNGVEVTADKALHEVDIEHRDAPADLADDAPGEKAGSANEDFLAAAAGRGEVWANPGDDGQNKNVPLVTTKEGEIYFSCALAGPGRHWLLAALTRKANIVPDDRMSAAQQLMVKYCETPLNEVKNMTLEWESTTAGDYPRLVLQRGELAARPEVQDSMTRRRAMMAPGQPAVSGSPAKPVKPGTLARMLLDPALRIFLGSPDQPAQSMDTVHRCERIINILTCADMWLGSDVLTTAERRSTLGTHAVQWGRPMLADKEVFSAADIRYARAQLAFLGYKLASPNYYSLERNFRANPNMTSTRYCAMAILAALIPDHPKAKEWAQGGLDEVERELKEWTCPDGGWIEAPHYQTVAMSEIFLLAFAAKNAGFADYLNDPRLLGAMRYLARISTPPDPRADNLRHFPPVGNTYYYETTGLFGMVAKVCREKHPALADELQWTWNQQGKNKNGLLVDLYNSALFAADDPPAPSWGSEHFRGSGVVLRSGFPADRETYLYLLQGWFAEHYNHDRGSFELWGKGRPLSLSWGYILSTGRVDAAHCNRVDVGNWGDIKTFQPFPAADYLHSTQQGWDRQVLFVKDANPLGANYYVMRDTIAQPAANWWMWLYTEHSPRLTGDVLRVSGLHDVDLDIWLAPKLAGYLKPGKAKSTAPAQHEKELDPEQRETETPAAGETPAALNTEPLGTPIETLTQTMKVFEMRRLTYQSLTQEGLHLPVTKDEPVFCVLYPRLKTEKPANFTALADGRGVKIVSAAGTDYVFLSLTPFEFHEGDVSFTGTAGVIRCRGNTVDLTVSEGGEIALGAHRLRAAQPATQSFIGDTPSPRTAADR